MALAEGIQRMYPLSLFSSFFVLFVCEWREYICAVYDFGLKEKFNSIITGIIIVLLLLMKESSLNSV